MFKIIIILYCFISVKVAAKYLAYQLPIRPTPNLDDFYLSLVDNSRSKYRSIKTRADKEAETGTAREICEVFIKNWASQRPKNENKVGPHPISIPIAALNPLGTVTDSC